MRLRLMSLLLMLAAVSTPAATLEEARSAVRVRDYTTAAAIYRGLAEAGDPEARYQLATLYRSGLGVEMNAAESRTLLRQAADQGYADAQYAFGQLLEKEAGEAADPAAAREWYRKAAGQRHRLAATRLKVLDDSTQVAAVLVRRARPAAMLPDVVSFTVYTTSTVVEAYSGASIVSAA